MGERLKKVLKKEMAPAVKRGRPRSEATRQAILHAAFRILKDEGLPRFTTSRLAAEAGVSTATLYRWWETKEAIALDAFLLHISTELSFDAQLSDPLNRLRDHVIRGAQFLGTGSGRAWVLLIMAIQGDEALRRDMIIKIFMPSRNAKLDLLQQAVELRRFPASFDPDLFADLVYGGLYYRVLFSHRPLTQQFAEAVFDTALLGARIHDRRGEAHRRRLTGLVPKERSVNPGRA